MENNVHTQTPPVQEPVQRTKFCKHCGGKIPEAAVVCTLCGCQVEDIKQQEQPNIVINNSNTSSNVNTNQNIIGGRYGRAKNKWIALLLCLFAGFFGAHKFYEGKAGMGILYLFTGGLFCIGWVLDILALLVKPNPYYV